MGEVIEKRRRCYSGLDADKASIPAGGKEVGDSYLATDTKINYFWDSVAWIIIPLDVIITGMIKNLNVTKEKAGLGFGRYVPRAVAAFEKTQADFTLDGNWKPDGLDLSIAPFNVPEGVVAVHIFLTVKDDASGNAFNIRGNATSKAINYVVASTQVANLYIPYMHAVIMVDSDRKLDYMGNAGIDAIRLALLGWYI